MNMLKHPIRIAFVDLTFNWPPVGGCWIDLHHVMLGLQSRGADVCLFTPDFQDYYPRGKVIESPPYPVVSIPFNRFSFNFKTVMKRFRDRVEAFAPDLVFLGDGYQMKNHLLTVLGPERCWLRFYAYELLCVNLHYYRYHEERVCGDGFFSDPVECHRCWFRRMPAAGRALQIATYQPERHPNLHFSQEYLASLAHTAGYHKRLLENLSRLKRAVVYNEFMKDRLAPYAGDIRVIPSGVDSSAFTPREGERVGGPVRVFLPGRANDPLKGMDVLIEACDRLNAEGLDVEVHYTAAMDRPSQRPWLINRGWVEPAALPALYREMDVIAVPSTWIEPFGITALEGMASAVPVVASRTGGLAHTVVHGETGFHFEAGDSHGLANALRRLVNDADLRDELGRNGRARIESVYDWNRILDERYIPLLNGDFTASGAALKPEAAAVS